MISNIEEGLIFSRSFRYVLACPLYAFGAYIHSVEKYINCLKYAYITISFSYAYLSGLHRLIQSAPAYIINKMLIHNMYSHIHAIYTFHFFIYLFIFFFFLRKQYTN